MRSNRITPPIYANDVFALYSQTSTPSAREELPPLAVTVSNCNLKFTRDPLIVGHYASAGLTGSERVVDEMVGGLLGEALKIGLYPSAPRSNQVFMNIASNGENPLQLPRPEAAIVVGLGQEGKLSSRELLETVRQGVLAWAQRLSEQHRGAPVLFEIAAALIGSGGAGMSPGQSAALIAQGVREANNRLQQKNWPTVSHLNLTELYLDRATEAWRAMRMLAVSRPNDFLVTATIKAGTGWLRRPLEGGYRSTRYDFISAITQYDENQLPMIAYTLDTKRARAEVRAQSTQVALLHELISASSNQPSAASSLGQTLFKLLVPLEMDTYLSGTTEMQIELDSSTASVPWELLNTDRNPSERQDEDQEPWAIRSKLLRRLRTEYYREQVLDATADDYVLIIGEPLADAQRYPRLPGARNEARAISRLFESALSADKVKSLIAEDTAPSLKVNALAVTSTLLAHDWRIVHIAGHGEPPLFEMPVLQDMDSPNKNAETQARMISPRGVVLSNNIFLGPQEIKSMREVPELVFINCCYLGALDSTKLLKVAHLKYDRTRFAATVAEELIAIGVRCVVVAGWAVDDAPAALFATHFYSQLLNGNRFIDAVASARRVAWKAAPGSNTWAAFQCYGDPDWVFIRTPRDANQPVSVADQGFDTIASYQSLVLALEIPIDDSRYKKVPRLQVINMIQALESRFGHLWIDIGQVCEAFAQAWAEAGESDRAIGWFECAISANDASASLKASEQLGELRARRAWLQVNLAGNLPQQEMSAVLSSARKQAGDAIELLARVCDLQPTPGRNSLCATAYKFLAWIEVLAKDSEAEQKALRQMERYFATVEQWTLANDPSHLYEPALGRLAAKLFDAEPTAAVQTDLMQLQAQIKPWVESYPDFHNVAAMILTALYVALHSGKLKPAAARLLSEFAELKRRVPAVLNWREVQMQADFVLDRYMTTASKGEKAAAKAFKERMTDWATAQD
ncbi:CHAT domain-containing protein [Pseudomonas sp.]|uniref:CHAT domain-containing protein n=1 Tax=Pseudomonas sp. TaxID=306 RepID=UPI003D6F44AC